LWQCSKTKIFPITGGYILDLTIFPSIFAAGAKYLFPAGYQIINVIVFKLFFNLKGHGDCKIYSLVIDTKIFPLFLNYFGISKYLLCDLKK